MTVQGVPLGTLIHQHSAASKPEVMMRVGQIKQAYFSY